MNLETVKTKNILFVGEGNFSFAVRYTLNANPPFHEQIYATCFATRSLTVEEEENIRIIREHGGVVYTDVDATKLEHHPHIMHIFFSKVIFNFPHVGKKMNIRDNRLLVSNFFKSAVRQLDDDGTIMVSLCQGQGGTEMDSVKREWCNTWQICSLAASASLILFDVKSFSAVNCLNYKCTGYRGLHKTFNTNGALTHFFCRDKPVEIERKEYDGSGLVEEFLKNSRLLFNNISEKLDYPATRIISFLHDVTDEKYPSNVKLNSQSLLVCKQFSSVTLEDSAKLSKQSIFCNDNNDNLNICYECLSSLVTEYLFSCIPNTNIISISCTICCVKYFDAYKLPLCNTVSYFVNDENMCFKFSIEIINELNTFLSQDSNVQSLSKLFSIDKVANAKTLPVLNSPVTNVCIEQISTLYAVYSSELCSCFYFYSGINVTLSDPQDTAPPNSKKSIVIGNIFKVTHNSRCFFFFMLNTDLIACLKFHVFDYRTLFIEDAFFTYCIFNDYPQIVYKTKSISPPSFLHDTSFWINEDFSERNLFLLVRNTVEFLAKDCVLIDSYYDQVKKRHAKCYRFIYQSYSKVLSKAKAWEIHTHIMRKTLEFVLNVHLR